jgi:hypothetical protein
VKIQHDVATIADEDAAFCVDAELLYSLDLLEERINVDDLKAIRKLVWTIDRGNSHIRSQSGSCLIIVSTKVIRGYNTSILTLWADNSRGQNMDVKFLVIVDDSLAWSDQAPPHADANLRDRHCSRPVRGLVSDTHVAMPIPPYLGSAAQLCSTAENVDELSLATISQLPAAFSASCCYPYPSSPLQQLLALTVIDGSENIPLGSQDYGSSHDVVKLFDSGVNCLLRRKVKSEVLRRTWTSISLLSFTRLSMECSQD